MRTLELLAPAKDINIGIAAIDCGADAIYIAGPEFGARKAAGNSVEDIERLCSYAHRFGVRVFITLNTIVYDRELSTLRCLIEDLKAAGADAFIIQDLAITEMEKELPLHASTQCAIRDVEKARFYEDMGCSRIVLERQLSLRQIREIREAVNTEIEFFVHGALCVSYSGNCYMSEYIAGRSANRGECVQACRALYDLEDGNGRVLVRNKALLSLKDLHLKGQVRKLAEAGVDSFKIEGRLKNLSYVKNTVREYSIALDELVGLFPDIYRRASFGKVQGGFAPCADRTFNRGYTQLFIDEKRGGWASLDAPKSMGELVGTVVDVRARGGQMAVRISPASASLLLSNGDGFSLVSKEKIIGFRGDVCQAHTIFAKEIKGISSGAKIYRNINTAFEKELEKNSPERLIDVSLNISFAKTNTLTAKVLTEDGRSAELSFDAGMEKAKDETRMLSIIKNQIEKKTNHYNFHLQDIKKAETTLPFMSAAFLNNIRRNIADELDKIPCNKHPLANIKKKSNPQHNATSLNFTANISNQVAYDIYSRNGAEIKEKAYEITHREGIELMRMKYCIKYELGLCPVHQKSGLKGPLFLTNNGRRFKLDFDCRLCEMSVTSAPLGK